jgi:hypothetical protein
MSCTKMLYLLIRKSPISCCLCTYMINKNKYRLICIFCMHSTFQLKKQTWSWAHSLKIVDSLETTNNRIFNYNQDNIIIMYQFIVKYCFQLKVINVLLEVNNCLINYKAYIFIIGIDNHSFKSLFITCTDWANNYFSLFDIPTFAIHL